MRLRIQPPNRPSRSARFLAAQIPDALVIRREGSRYRSRFNDVVINWGNPQQIFRGDQHYWINDPLMVRRAINKEWAWNRWEERGVPTVLHTDDPHVAHGWLSNGDRLLVRTSLQLSGGRGIRCFSLEGTDWTEPWSNYTPDDDTYVKVFGRNPKHVTEYRVHVVRGEVIDFIQKKRRRDYEGTPNPYVRSHDNGWVFCREEIELPSVAHAAAQAAVEALALDFGAVDLGVCRDGTVCVYEVNTAPGIEGTTHDRYAVALAELAGLLVNGVEPYRNHRLRRAG